MARFCTKCGKEIPEGVAFCTECGAAAPTGRAAPQAEVKPEQPPRTVAVAAEKTKKSKGKDHIMAEEKNNVVGTATYFGLMILFAIPIVGWLVCLFMSLKSKNANLKHFAKAMLIWIVIGIVISIIGYFAFNWIGNMMTDYINELTGGQFGDLQELLEQFKQFENGDITALTGDQV